MSTVRIADPFLRDHQVGPLSFSIPAPVLPIGIRDQMIGAKLFVEAGKNANLISSSRKLLIVGGGATGISIAIEAAQCGVGVVLIEKTSRAFDLQTRCLTRWLDPTQYDWPFPRWRAGSFPWPSVLPPDRPVPSVALPWRARRANRTACGWRLILNRAQRFLPHLDIRYETTLDFASPAITGNQMSAHFLRLGKRTEEAERFGCVVYSLNSAKEITSIGNFESFGYWETDPYGEIPLGRLLALKDLPIAVCGGGDGALEDFLRVVTGLKSAAHLMAPLRHYLPNRLLLHLADEEDNAQRQLVRGRESKEDHEVFSGLHSVYTAAAQEAAANPAIADVLDGLFEERLTRLRITLFHVCDHFGQCFPLNRFLVLLLAAWAAQRHLPVAIEQRMRLVAVRGIHHKCRSDKRECHGLRHGLEFLTEADCGSRSNRRYYTNAMARMVILRLGATDELDWPAPPRKLIHSP